MDGIGEVVESELRTSEQQKFQDQLDKGLMPNEFSPILEKAWANTFVILHLAKAANRHFRNGDYEEGEDSLRKTVLYLKKLEEMV